MRILIFVCGMTLSAASGALAQTAQRGAASQNSTPFEYVAPTDPSHQPIYAFAKQVRILERASSFFALFRLPKPLALKAKGCEGDINAYYENDVITICYEYLKYIGDLARSRTRPVDLSEADAFVGPVIEVFLHEGGHALFEYLKIPLFGKEEDAADQFASLGLLSFNEETSRTLLAGVLHMYMTEGGYKNIRKLNRRRIAIVDARESSDEHSTPLQRMYSALCMAVGTGRTGYAELAGMAGLSKDRLELCPGEFKQVVYAFRTLMLPHVDPAKTEEFRKFDWFKDAP
jgi:hypothetical protein